MDHLSLEERLPPMNLQLITRNTPLILSNLTQTFPLKTKKKVWMRVGLDGDQAVKQGLMMVSTMRTLRVNRNSRTCLKRPHPVKMVMRSSILA